MTLSEREQIVLEALVERFIDNPGPVSSGQLASELDLGVSSATIRNVLHGLAEKGFLYQPHTSAGRVPTREAYRAYVDGLSQPTRLPEKLARHIREEIEQHNLGVQELLARASATLAVLSNNVGISLAVEDHSEALIERVEIVQLQASRILIVVTLDDGDVRTCIAPTDHDISLRALDVAVQVVNETVVDCTPAEARIRLDVALRDTQGEAASVTQAISREKNRLFQDGGLPSLHLEGASQIMGQPEFKDPSNLKVLVRILDQPHVLQSVLRDPKSMSGVVIHVGVESETPDLQAFSLISAPVSMAGRPGVLGILGPIRMNYPVALSLVSFIVETIRCAEDESQ